MTDDVLKLGGELLEDAAAMRRRPARSRALAARGPVVVVHGGGRAIDAELRARGKEPQFVDGLRITDADALETVVAVLAGRTNTAFVAALHAAGVRAVGLTGADAAHRARDAGAAAATTARQSRGSRSRRRAARRTRRSLLTDLRGSATCRSSPASASTRDGALLNVNADTLAAHLARRARGRRLIIAGGTAGVLDDRGQRSPALDADEAGAMIASGTARAGMVAKLGRLPSTPRPAASRRCAIVDGRGGRISDRAAGTHDRCGPSASARDDDHDCTADRDRSRGAARAAGLPAQPGGVRVAARAAALFTR